jgi:hypothetical protein
MGFVAALLLAGFGFAVALLFAEARHRDGFMPICAFDSHDEKYDQHNGRGDNQNRYQPKTAENIRPPRFLSILIAASANALRGLIELFCQSAIRAVYAALQSISESSRSQIGSHLADDLSGGFIRYIRFKTATHFHSRRAAIDSLSVRLAYCHQKQQTELAHSRAYAPFVCQLTRVFFDRAAFETVCGYSDDGEFRLVSDGEIAQARVNRLLFFTGEFRREIIDQSLTGWNIKLSLRSGNNEQKRGGAHQHFLQSHSENLYGTFRAPPL